MSKNNKEKETMTLKLNTLKISKLFSLLSYRDFRAIQIINSSINKIET